jgi:hypothetical protein
MNPDRRRAQRHAGWLLVASLGALALSGACARVHGDACSVDVDCSGGKVCREGMCRKPCLSPRWVGERVEVVTGNVSRQAQIAACEQRQYWVRYESGVEEQVTESRLRSRSGR